MLSAVIFGGTGFIGTYFAQHLVDNQNYQRVYLYDNEGISVKSSVHRKDLILQSSAKKV